MMTTQCTTIRKWHDDITILSRLFLLLFSALFVCILYSHRRDSFITHRAFCDALAEESSRNLPQTAPNNHHQHPQIHGFHHLIPLKQETLSFSLPPWLSPDPFQENPNPNPNQNPNATFFTPSSGAGPSLMSATALLQKAAQMGVTMSGGGKMAYQPSDHDDDDDGSMLGSGGGGGGGGRPQHHVGGQGFCATSSTATAGLPSREDFMHGLAAYGGKLANLTAGCMEGNMQENMAMAAAAAANSMPSTSGFQGFDDSFNGIFSAKRSFESFQQDSHFMGLRREGGGGGGGDGMTRDFLGLRAFPHRDFSNMAGLDQMGSSSSSFDQNQAPWQS